MTIIDGNKLFTIKEVAKLIGVPAYTLKNWEKDFKEIFKSKKTSKGEKRYDWESIKAASKIKELVVNKGLKPEVALRQLFHQTQTNVLLSQNIINSATSTAKSNEKIEAFTDSIAEKVASDLKERLSQTYMHIPRKTKIEI
jgi:DNA-binding transcriptional MerR regulator